MLDSNAMSTDNRVALTVVRRELYVSRQDKAALPYCRDHTLIRQLLGRLVRWVSHSTPIPWLRVMNALWEVEIDQTVGGIVTRDRSTQHIAALIYNYPPEVKVSLPVQRPLLR